MPGCPRLVAWREQVAREKRAAFRDETTGAGRSRASVTRGAGARRSGSRRPRTAATAPGGCSRATARGDWLFAALHRAGLAEPADLGPRRRRSGAPRRRTSPRRSAARRRRTSRRPRSATPACPTWSASCELLDRGARDRRARRVRVRRRAAGDRRPARDAVPSRARGSATASRSPPAALTGPRLLPPEPAEHLHRQAHRADARRRVPRRVLAGLRDLEASARSRRRRTRPRSTPRTIATVMRSTRSEERMARWAPTCAPGITLIASGSRSTSRCCRAARG